MPKHVKPTKEELEANTRKALEEAEKMKEKPEEKKEETPEKPPEKVEKKEEKPQEPDYKKKFIASSQEAILLHEKNKRVSEALTEASTVPDPTEDELRKEYPDWDMMGEFEKKMATDSLRNNRRFAIIDKIASETKNLDAWQKQVDEFIDDPKVLVDNPELEGREDEFRLFATKPTRRGADFEDLVNAFLYDLSKAAKPVRKARMFEEGTGGDKTSEVNESDKMTVEEARELRKRDYKKWREMMDAGKIESVV